MPTLLGGGNYTTSQASYDLTRLRTKDFDASGAALAGR
jgi:hypothetical protein